MKPGDALRAANNRPYPSHPPTYDASFDTIACPHCARPVLRERHEVGTHRMCVGCGGLFVQSKPGEPAGVGEIRIFNQQTARPVAENYLAGRPRGSL